MKLKTIATAALLIIATNMFANMEEKTASSPISNDRLTPEILWNMGRIGSVDLSPDGKSALYTVTTYNKEKNNSHTAIYLLDISSHRSNCLTRGAESQNAPRFIQGGQRISFLAQANGVSQIFSMSLDGRDIRQLSFETTDVEDYLFSPNGQQAIIIKQVPYNESIEKKDDDLPLASGMVIDELMYKHWDHYVTSIPHPFVARIVNDRLVDATDILDGQPYECPMLPFGGIEQLAWSPDGKTIAYTCRKKTGRDYAISTDSDIFLYTVSTKSTKNLCKPAGYVEPAIDPLRSMRDQAINSAENLKNNPGYDQNPQFSPDGKFVAWLSMPRNGYESDRSRLCVYNIASGKKQYVTEQFDSPVNDFVWSQDSRKLYFTGVWNARCNIWQTDLNGKLHQITNDVSDYSLVAFNPQLKNILVKRHSISNADELYCVSLRGKADRITDVNRATYDKVTMGDVRERMVTTIDGKQMQCWVIYPPHFDPQKKYPTLLYCEGGPQSPVSQFWSFRWNFQIMAAHDYIIIAPNRRGLPGFGQEWLEEISGDYTGLCMSDYLSAIDDISRESYVDTAHLGCVGASFGGYSVYWLAGHHQGRFKCFIAHDGIFNTQQQYVETEEMWFPNWDMGGAPWTFEKNNVAKVFSQSPHLFVDKWDTPILCIHGQRDFRIEYTQAESAFTVARIRGIPAKMLLFPDENHWVLKPQNGILWQRTFFRWLDKWLKN